MESGKKGKPGASEHGEMEMGHYKMGVMDMDIGSGSAQHKACQPAHGKQVNKTQG